MSSRKTERLLNLVICLLATRRYLGADAIRQAVPGYPDSDEAFKRMFERDKEDLRELGVPLQTGTDSIWDDEVGYRIRRSDYELPPISLEPDESAVVALAAQVWQRASLAGAASGALLKLRAAGIETTEPTPPGIEPRVNTSEPSFPVLWAAVRDRRPVRFDYRPAGGGEPRPRRLEPWGVVSWHGRWYVTGHDLDREAVRVFRLSRIAGDVHTTGPAGSIQVPEEIDVREIVVSGAVSRDTDDVLRTAVLALHPGKAQGLRRIATDNIAEGAGSQDAGDDWDSVGIQFTEAERLAGFIAGFGADARVVEPEDLREAVIRRLSSAAEEPV